MTPSDPKPPVPPAIVTEHVTIRYGRQRALQDVSLNIAAGGITALIGPSGCGKTSFLLSLNRLTDLIPSCTVSGRIRVGTSDVLGRQTDVVQLRRRVGMIFQRPNPFPLSIYRNLELPLREHGERDRARLDQRIEGALRDVGLWDEVKDRLRRSALALSGGQQQRLCLARCLVLDPEILLLDEPCSALDPISAGVIEQLISGMRGKYTLLMVTHNLAQARRLSDRAALLWSDGDGGRLIEYGQSDQVFQSPREPLTQDYVSGRVG